MGSVQITIEDRNGKADFEFAFSESIDVNQVQISPALEYGRLIMGFIATLDREGFDATFKGYPVLKESEQN